MGRLKTIVSRLVGAFTRNEVATEVDSASELDEPSEPEYPDCFRGLRNSSCYSKRGVKAEAFLPNPKTGEQRRAAEKRPFGEETSINWNDNEDVLSMTAKDAQNAAHGVARVDMQMLRGALNGQSSDDRLRLYWERDKLPHNAHHGNFIFEEGMSAEKKNQVAALLAALSQRQDC